MDETTTDVVPTEGGEQIAPQSDASPEGTEQGSPSEGSTIEVLSQQVIDLTGLVRALQSDKDRGVAKVQTQVDGLSEKLESYHRRREQGLTETEAQRAEVLDQIVSERIAPTPDRLTVSQDSVPAEQAPVTVEAYLSPILRLTGLDANDPEIIELLRTERDAAKRITAIGELAEARNEAPKTQPNPAAQLAGGGGQAVEEGTLESVTEELKEVLAMPATPATRKRIQELGKQQKELLPK